MADIKITPPSDDDQNKPEGKEPKKDNPSPESNESFKLEGEAATPKEGVTESTDAPKPADEAPKDNALEGMIGADESSEPVAAPITPPELADSPKPAAETAKADSKEEGEPEDTSEEESIMEKAAAAEAKVETTGQAATEETEKKKFPL